MRIILIEVASQIYEKIGLQPLSNLRKQLLI